jgi:hypothetical protein
MTLQAQGWYRDPYAIHEDRYISQGVPTKLVRDGDREAYDPPPDRPMPPGELVPADGAGADAPDGSDLRRAGDTYDPDRAKDAVFGVFDRSSGAL